MTEKEKIRHIFHKLCDLETSAKTIRGVYWQSPHTMTQRVYGSMHLSDVRPSVRRPSVTTGDAKRRIKYIQSDSPDGSTNFTPRRLLKMAHRGRSLKSTTALICTEQESRKGEARKTIAFCVTNVVPGFLGAV